MERAQWQRILDAGLSTSITTPEQYVDAFLKQLNEVVHTILSSRSDSFAIPTADTLRSIHYDIFHDIYLSAGKFRNTLVYFDHGMIGTDPQSLNREMEAICDDGLKSLSEAESIQDQAIAIAVMQGRTRRAHCFIDGNTRTAACVLLSQIKEVFDKDTVLIPPEKLPEFKSNLALAYRGIIAPFTNNFILEPIGAQLIEHREINIPKQFFIESADNSEKVNQATIFERMKQMLGLNTVEEQRIPKPSNLFRRTATKQSDRRRNNHDKTDHLSGERVSWPQGL